MFPDGIFNNFAYLIRVERIFKLSVPKINKFSNIIQSFLIGSLPLFFIILQFNSGSQIKNLLSIIIVVLLVVCLPNIKGLILYISLFLLSISLFLMLYYNAPLKEWSDSLRVNLTLVSIFIVVPLLGIPVRIGGYVDSFRVLFSNLINKPFFLYFGMNLLTHLL